MLSREPRHDGVLVPRPVRRRPRAAVHRRAPTRRRATAPSTCGRTSGDPARCSSSPTTTPSSSGSSRAPFPGRAARRHASWTEVRPEEPTRAAGAGRRVRGARRGLAASRWRAPAAGPRPPTTWPAPGVEVAQPLRRGRGPAWPATPGTTPRRSPVTDQSCTEPPVHADGVARRRHGDRRRTATRRPATTRRRTSARSGPSPPPTAPRRRPRSCGTTTHAAGRHRTGAGLRLRRLRVQSSSPTGRSRCPRCSTGASSTCTPTCAAAARAAVAGGWRDDCTPSRTPSPTTSRSPTASRRTGSSTPTGSRPAGSQRRRPAAGRRVQPAPRPLARRRGRGAVRRRRDHHARRHDPAHRHRVGRVGRPARPRASSTRCSPTRRTTTLPPRAAGPTCSSPEPCTTRG